ncbi:MAG: hypothetical protein IKC37_02340 [Clostridia bacterium]|nr:hypothetical protein [Clostridia bacterium]
MGKPTAKEALLKTLHIVKLIAYFFGLLTQLVYIGFLIYTCVVKTEGEKIANIILLSVAVSYFIFFVILTKFGRDMDAKKHSKIANTIFKWCKRLVKLYTIGVMVYGIFFLTGRATIASVLMCAFMITTFVLQLVFELLVFIITRQTKKAIGAIKTKMQNSNVHPIQSTKRFFTKIKCKLTGRVLAIPITDEEAAEIMARQALEREIENQPVDEIVGEIIDDVVDEIVEQTSENEQEEIAVSEPPISSQDEEETEEPDIKILEKTEKTEA